MKMSIPHHTFGPTTIARVRDADELRQLLGDPWLKSETIIIKPNWVSTDPADFTDAETLQILFEALDARFVITESYILSRSLNLLEVGLPFKVEGEEVNWKWLLKSDGWQWLTENPGWEWFKQEGHWEQIRAEEQAFLDQYGFTDLFAAFDVSYVNVTEEVWSGRIADPADVKRAVESRFPPVQTELLYSFVPRKLYDLRGSTFVSFARLKMYASFTFKNLFGMIPDPLRPWWHGPKNCRIAHSIIDINKVYHALFNVYGICEALNTTAFIHPEGKNEGIFAGKYNMVEDLGVVALGRDLVALDTLLLHLTDPTTRWVATEVNRAPLELAADVFGAYDEDFFKEAKDKVGGWLSPQPQDP
jgi:hypothetical protein